MAVRKPTRVETQRTCVLVSFGLAIITNFYYLSGRGVAGDYEGAAFHVEHTAFTPNVLFLLLFWAAAYFAQIAYMHQLFAGSDDSKKAAGLAGWYVVSFNTMHFLWLMFFSHGHFVVAEVVMCLNFLFTASLYFQKRTQTLTPPSLWLTVHMGACAMPFAWTLFGIFWSGAVATHSHSLVGRLFANVFIWVLFAIPTFALLVFADWGFAYASSFLTWGLAVAQILEKTFALQWIFAIIIATLVTIEATIIMFASGFTGLGNNNENVAELLENVRREAGEQSPLIGR
ncbi:hypothetical protein V1512DRAFT_263320 [Lipomyces arxii]|uniref:uncharacterized protein n=1 Tax=Lipomyces arxii TaxID=56418 RepID=UPI0034CD7D51